MTIDADVRNALRDGLQAEDLRPCDSCGGPVAGRLRDGHSALDLYRLELQLDRLVLHPTGVQQLLALEQFFQGATGLATAFAAQPVAAQISSQRLRLLLCQPCFLNRSLAEIAEGARARERRRAEPIERAVNPGTDMEEERAIAGAIDRATKER